MGGKALGGRRGEDELDDVGVILREVELLLGTTGSLLRVDERPGLVSVFFRSGSDTAALVDSPFGGKEYPPVIAAGADTEWGSEGFLAGNDGGVGDGTERLGITLVNNEPKSIHVCAA